MGVFNSRSDRSEEQLISWLDARRPSLNKEILLRLLFIYSYSERLANKLKCLNLTSNATLV